MDEEECWPCFEDLLKWPKKRLQDWLSEHGLPKSGTKDVLAKRVYRSMGADSDSSSDDEPVHHPTIPPLSSLLTGWITPQLETLPPIQDKDVENFFVHRKNPQSGQSQNSHRQLAKSKKLCNEGHVFNMMQHMIEPNNSYMYVTGKCKPTMRHKVTIDGLSTDSYTLHVCLAKDTGFVHSAKCNCKAGIAGICSHVGAALLTLCKMCQPCTSTACGWNRPKASRPVSPKRWKDIPVINTEKQDLSAPQVVRPYPNVFQAGPCNDADLFLSQVLERLGDVNQECVLYKTLCQDSANIYYFVEIYTTHFSYRDSVDLRSPVCRAEFWQFLAGIQMTDEITQQLERATRGQAGNKNWHKARSLILTSSNFGSICKMRETTQPDNLLKMLRGYRTLPDTIKSIRHGRLMEPKARFV